MAGTDKPRIIAVEEHFQDPEIVAAMGGAERPPGGSMEEQLQDLAELRLKDMDEAGIDMQVISHGSPSAIHLKPDVAVEICRNVNNRLAKAIEAHPDRFRGFAVLPASVPEAAADELQRAVEELGLVGSMMNGRGHDDTFLDDKRYRPIFARAEKLDVPIYIHPALPHPQVVDIYYKEYVKEYGRVIRSGWGFGVETGTQAVRFVLSGLFQEHPNLQLILGHLGETLPFLLWRINHSLSRPGQKDINFRDIFSRHFYVTTSGFFSDPALNCVMTELGADRVLFAVDWPHVANKEGTEWAYRLQVSVEDKEKILSGNATRLLKL